MRRYKGFLRSKIRIRASYDPFAGLYEKGFVFLQKGHAEAVGWAMESGKRDDADAFASHEFVGEVLVHTEPVVFDRVEVESDFLGRGRELLAFERVGNRSE